MIDFYFQPGTIFWLQPRERIADPEPDSTLGPLPERVALGVMRYVPLSGSYLGDTFRVDDASLAQRLLDKPELVEVMPWVDSEYMTLRAYWQDPIDGGLGLNVAISPFRPGARSLPELRCYNAEQMLEPFVGLQLEAVVETGDTSYMRVKPIAVTEENASRLTAAILTGLFGNHAGNGTS